MEWISGLLLGAAYVLPPGPVTIETVRRGMRGGTPAAVAVQLGAVGGDLCYAALMAGGLSALLGHAALQRWLGLIGAALLVALGLATLRDRGLGELHPAPSGAVTGARHELAQHLGAGLALGLANPFSVAFWLAVGGTALQDPASLGGFLAGALLSALLTALAAGQLHHPRWRGVVGWIGVGCGVALVLLGAQLGLATLFG